MEVVKEKYVLLSLLFAVIAYMLPLGFAGGAHVMIFILVFTVGLWLTEAVPLHATAILAAFLLIVMMGLSPTDVFAQYFDPVIVLLLGGFVIAVAMSKHKLDEYLAHKILARAGTSPKLAVLALMGTATFISMWINNSSAAAIVMPIAIVVLVKNRVAVGASNFGKACVLGVGYGATIGGIGTIIGSTPNVIATKFLHDAGISFEFFDWFYRGFPFMIILMFAGWLVLITLFKPEQATIKPLGRTGRMTMEQKKVLAIFALTIFLWMTEKTLHNITSSAVAIVPIILFYFFGLLNTGDFMKVDWATLIFLGGSLAVGFGIHASKLDMAFASVIGGATGGQSILAIFLMLGIAGALLTSFISNTTAAAVYLPIVAALAATLGVSPTNAIFVAAAGVSLDFVFPFGTPPTAIAHGTHYVSTKDIAKAGLAITIIGILLLAGMAMLW
jgi:solute carrier family 13 (sodium-dependent dicarboxylate transporter), member 2/3/5